MFTYYSQTGIIPQTDEQYVSIQAIKFIKTIEILRFGFMGDILKYLIIRETLKSWWTKDTHILKGKLKQFKRWNHVPVHRQNVILKLFFCSQRCPFNV